MSLPLKWRVKFRRFRIWWTGDKQTLGMSEAKYARFYDSYDPPER